MSIFESMKSMTVYGKIIAFNTWFLRACLSVICDVDFTKKYFYRKVRKASILTWFLSACLTANGDFVVPPSETVWRKLLLVVARLAGWLAALRSARVVIGQHNTIK